MEEIKGVKTRFEKGYTLIEITEFSDGLRSKLDSELTKICHGDFALVDGFAYHEYEHTLQELIRRIPSDERKQVGFIGELLLHVIIRNFTENSIVSPFFNMEQKDAKKGFDIISRDKDENIWLVESKSGQLGGQYNSVDKKILERLKVAENDLLERLNEQRSQLWLNAMNSVNAAMSNSNEKAALVQILSGISSTNESNDKKVILGGIVFAPFSSHINPEDIDKRLKEINDKENFSEVMIIGIHKQTYQAVLDYLTR